MNCERCPCPEICLAAIHPGPRFAYMCRRADSGSEIELRSIRERSMIGIEDVPSPDDDAARAARLIAETMETLTPVRRGGCCG